MPADRKTVLLPASHCRLSQAFIEWLLCVQYWGMGVGEGALLRELTEEGEGMDGGPRELIIYCSRQDLTH